MGIKTKKLIIAFAAMVAFATVSSNINFANPTASAKTHKAKKKHKVKSTAKKDVNSKKSVNSQSSSSSNNTFNKIYSNSEAEQIIRQKLLDFINTKRQSQGNQPLTISANLSKLADERATLIDNDNDITTGEFYADNVTHDGTEPQSVKGAYVDGFEMGIFPDDQSISNKINEYVVTQYRVPVQFRYSDIADAVNIFEYNLNNQYTSSSQTVFGKYGNGYNYAGVEVKLIDVHKQGISQNLVLDIISSDTNY